MNWTDGEQEFRLRRPLGVMSAVGTFETFRDVRVESAFEGKPDLTIATADFRV